MATICFLFAMSAVVIGADTSDPRRSIMLIVGGGLLGAENFALVSFGLLKLAKRAQKGG